MESEFVSASEAAKSITWIVKLLGELGVQEPKPVLQMDSQSAIDMSKNPANYRRSKHIERKYYYVKNLYQRQIIDKNWLIS